MRQTMDGKVSEFNQKRALFNQAFQLLREKYYIRNNFNSFYRQNSNEIKHIINNLHWIKKMLDKATFDSNNANHTLIEQKIDTYIDITDHALQFCYEQHTDFRLYYNESPKDRLNTSIGLLGSSFNILLLIEKILLIPTLLLAASPMLMISVAPTLFADAILLISPLLLMLPPLTYAACAVGALLLGVKLIQMGLKYYAQKEEVNLQSSSKDTKHDAADKLLKSADAVEKMGEGAKQGFFDTFKKHDQSFHGSTKRFEFDRR